MKAAWLGIGCLLATLATPATSLACGPPTDTLCGIVHSMEEVDLGPDLVGLILKGPFAFGTITCSCEGSQEEVAVTDLVEVHLFCDATDDECLEEMDEALTGSLDGKFALFTTLFPWTKMKGGQGFPSFVKAESSNLEAVESWAYQLIQPIPPSFAVQNRICRAASEMEVPEPPVPVIDEEFVDRVLDISIPTAEPGVLRTLEPISPPSEPEEEGRAAEVDEKLPGTEETLGVDEAPPATEEFIPALDGELPPAGCTAARGDSPASAATGLVWMVVMGALLRRREARGLPAS